MKTHQTSLLLLNLAVALAGAFAAHAAPVSTSFTYQGQLKSNGVPVNTPQDFRFTLYPASTGASPIGNPSVNEFLCQPVANGLFTLGLNFGDVAAYNGQARWLEIAVRPCGEARYQVMPQRVELLPTPYALQSLSARQVEPNGVDASALKSGAVTGEKILDGTIGATKVNPSTFGATFWKVDGNAGTTAGANFLGTADNQPLEFKVDGVRALRLQPHATEPSSLVGGYFQNSLGGAGGAVIAGGGTSGSINETFGNYAFVGAGHGSKAGGFSAVVGGAYNVSPSLYSFIGSGLGNTNLGGAAVIAGGVYNLVSALGENAFIGGGVRNTANNIYATIGGGEQNVSSMFATVGGGRGNQGGGSYSTVAGGRENRTAATYASSGGGYFNLSGGQYATVAGGTRNVSDSTGSTIGGGSNNVIQVTSDAAAIGGGRDNSVQGGAETATVAGGAQNRALGPGGAIGGGGNNVVSSFNSTISGGANNTADANASSISGGSENHASGDHSTIGGGQGNISSGVDTTVGGGYRNTSTGEVATVSGGFLNTSSGRVATVSGGYANSASGVAATVPGGNSNVASGDSSLAAGSYSQASGFIATALGEGNLASKRAAVAIGSFTAATEDFTMSAGRKAKANHRGSFVWADSQDFDFASTAEDQFSIRALGGIRLETTGATLNGRPLLTSADLGNLWQLGGNNIAPGQFLGTANAEPLEFKVNGIRALRLEPSIKDAVNVIGGSPVNSVAVGVRGATIAGGGEILDGIFPIANSVTADFGTVGGGSANTASGAAATVGGGHANRSSGEDATVGGGLDNLATGNDATVPGGCRNHAMGNLSFAAGNRAQAKHDGAFVWADSTDTDFESTAANQFNIRASGGVRLSDDTPNISFGSTTRQVLNLWNTRYGIGVQPSTLYFRANNGTSTDGFAWFKGGSHAEAAKDPGAGGQMLMALDDRGLFVTKGDLHWSVGGALVDNQGGSIELGPQFSSSVRTPFIDFHYSSGVINIEDYNVRLINDANRRLTVDGNLSVTGTISPPSDRNVKAGFEPVDTKAILEKVAALPLTRWHYTNDTATPHLGPVAQDFHAAFGLGSDDKHIATVDADGVALAAIQGLNQKLEEKEKEITELKQSLEELKGLVIKLAGQQNRGAR